MMIAKLLKQTLLIMLSALIVLPSAGCAEKTDEPETDYLFAMDTVMTCKVYGKNAEAAIAAAWAEVGRVEALLSKTDPASEISAINSSATGGAEVSSETARLIELALEYSSLTGGAFDITVGPVMEAWDFIGENPKVPDAALISELLQNVGSEYVEVSGNTVTLTRSFMSVDLGGIGKGCASDLAASAARENGAESALFSLGGNVIVIGGKPDGSPWVVAVKDPRGGEGYIGRLSVRDACVVTSGGYERFFGADGETYHHIIDPKTGFPTESGLISVTVVCESGTVADILSTALFVMGKDSALDFWRGHGGFGLVLVTDAGEVIVTANIASIFEFSGAEAGYFYADSQNP